jgi:hypothetical protein
MAETVDIINGWEVRGTSGGYGVYDLHGMVSGPHQSKTDAIGAALQLPLSRPQVFSAQEDTRPARSPALHFDEDGAAGRDPLGRRR